MTIGLTWRRTARRIKRLKEGVLTISPDYSDRDPRLFGALQVKAIKVKGQWVYLYRAVDKQGRTVDFLLSQRRDVATAKRFFSHATRQHGAPRVITLDGYAASHRAVAQLKEVGTLPRRVRIRSSQYLNNVVEQDHRRIKQRIRPMLGFKRFETAAVTIRGIEL